MYRPGVEITYRPDNFTGEMIKSTLSGHTYSYSYVSSSPQ